MRWTSDVRIYKPQLVKAKISLNKVDFLDYINIWKNANLEIGAKYGANLTELIDFHFP